MDQPRRRRRRSQAAAARLVTKSFVNISRGVTICRAVRSELAGPELKPPISTVSDDVVISEARSRAVLLSPARCF